MTHADLLAAIDKARPEFTPVPRPEDRERRAHLDALRAILDLHGDAVRGDARSCNHDEFGWPCPTVQIVADALTGMGALDGDDNTSEVCMIPGCGCDGRSHA